MSDPTGARYALELAYRGTAYAGWQRQPNARTVEQTVDEALALVLNRPIKIVGCGRTDAGVHASAYLAHFDAAPGALPPGLLPRLNRLLPDDVALYALHRVPDGFHARFSAVARAYRYRIARRKDPFRPDAVTVLPRPDRFDRDLLRRAAALLPAYSAFAPFCKTNSDAFTMNCELHHAEWTFGAEEWEFRIGANRFLRGMVRLIVGMCLTVAEGRMSLDEVRAALDEQRPLARPRSAPAAGLYLSAVTYPDRAGWQLVEEV